MPLVSRLVTAPSPKEMWVLALVCRRGNVRSQGIGAIRVGEYETLVEVAEQLAPAFARAASEPDERNPKVRIRPWDPARRPENLGRRADGPGFKNRPPHRSERKPDRQSPKNARRGGPRHTP